MQFMLHGVLTIAVMLPWQYSIHSWTCNNITHSLWSNEHRSYHYSQYKLRKVFILMYSINYTNQSIHFQKVWRNQDGYDIVWFWNIKNIQFIVYHKIQNCTTYLQIKYTCTFFKTLQAICMHSVDKTHLHDFRNLFFMSLEFDFRSSSLNS